MNSKLSQALAGYRMHLDAKHLSQNTVNDYLNTLRKFQKHFPKDLPIADISVKDIEKFLATQTVSNKTLKNYHSTLSTLWKWLQKQDLVEANLLEKIDRPKAEKRVIKPIPLDDIKKLIAAARESNN